MVMELSERSSGDPMNERTEQRKPATLRDVARRANVSIQTISRVINNKSEVSPATRQRVLEAIGELGYQPNTLARSLVTSTSQVIGLVLPDISLGFYPVIARGVEDGAHALGYSVFLSNADGNPEREIEALDRLRGHRVAGVILCNSKLDERTLARMARGPAPVVLINRQIPDVSSTVIWTGYYPGGVLACEHLVASGRTKIAYLGIDAESFFNVEKFNAFRDVLTAAGLPIDERRIVECEGATFRHGVSGLAELIARGVEFDALFAFNDNLAIGAMHEAKKHGLRVPDDVAIIGFGGSDIAAMVTPALSTISVPLYDIGLSAVQELLRLISGGNQEHREVHNEPRLVVRDSTVFGATTATTAERASM
jgi:LacI family transcriptional regulator